MHIFFFYLQLGILVVLYCPFHIPLSPAFSESLHLKVMPSNYHTCYPFFLLSFIVTLTLLQLAHHLPYNSSTDILLDGFNIHGVVPPNTQSSSTSLKIIFIIIAIQTLWHTQNPCHPKMFHFWNCRPHYPILKLPFFALLLLYYVICFLVSRKLLSIFQWVK